jgi:hypothetical protein
MEGLDQIDEACNSAKKSFRRRVVHVNKFVRVSVGFITEQPREGCTRNLKERGIRNRCVTIP